MKNIILLACIGIATAIFSTPSAQAQTDGTVYRMGTIKDSVKGNTTKRQTASITTPNVGITISYKCTHEADTITGYASVWGSVDGVTFAPWPGADSIAIPAVGTVTKLWFLRNPSEENPVKWAEVRTRAVSNTTNATSKARLDTQLYPYK